MRFLASWVFRCPFWVYFQQKYPECNLVSRKNFERGKIAEREFEKLLKERRIRYSYQRHLSLKTSNYSISGRADFITSDRVYELKSVRMFRKPNKNWVGQLNLYMAMSGKRKGSLVQYNGVEFKEYRVNYSKELLEESLKYFERIRSGKILREYTHCNSCVFAFICLR